MVVMKIASVVVFSAFIALCAVTKGAFGSDDTVPLINGVHSGSCGDHLTWTFDDGTLVMTISGYGEMKNYNVSDFAGPWYNNYKDLIETVVIEDGVTSIGAYAFRSCQKIKSVSFPSSLVSIGEHAFFECNGLSTLVVPDHLKVIDDQAFCECNGLKNVTIVGDMISFGVDTFKDCHSLESLTIYGYNYSVNVDETGNGQASNIDITSYTTSTDYQFVSVEGVVSFNDDYTTFETIEKFNKNRNRKEDIGVYYNLLGSTKSRYVIKFKVDSNVSETADTDAFFLIESVKVKFTATVNNSTKDFEYDLKPNFFGIAEIPTDDEFSSSITNTSFKYTNGYYLGY